jgi:uncharacterized membrane protein (GlpM family)
MQSNPQPSVPPTRPSRPVYLVVALIVGWTFGIGGVMGGCGLLRFYQEPDTAVEVHEPANDGFDAYFAQQQKAAKEASAKALNENSGRMVPLASANVLLSALLIVACARALAAKRNAHNLAIQAVAANIVYAIADYIVSSPIREAVIAAASVRPAPADMQQLDPNQLALAVTWSFRLLSAGHVVTLGLIAYALTRPRVVAFFRPDDNEPTSEGS